MHSTANTDMSTVSTSQNAAPMGPLHASVIVFWSSAQQPEVQHAPPTAPDWLQGSDIHHSSRHDPGAALHAAAAQFPGRSLLLIRSDCQLPAELLQRLQWWQQHSQAGALTCCSNAADEFNPFGFSRIDQSVPDDADLDALVANTSKRPSLQATQWPQHLLWLSAETLHLLQQQEALQLRRSPQACGINLIIADDIFSRSRNQPLWTNQPAYLWDMPPATAIEYRQQQLQQLLQQQCYELARLPVDSTAVTLHISHSWGGGIQHWIDNYCHSDSGHVQLVLKSQGFWKNKTYGSRLSLHQGAVDGPELHSWWLVPAIASTSIRHPQYIEMLDEICQRYQVQRILVGSLIGHSLDVFRRSLPTIAVVHDYYPAWPLLSQAPGTDPASLTLPRRLDELKQQPHNVHGDDLLMFCDRDARGWNSLTLAWQYMLQQKHVAVVTPSNSARTQLLQLLPSLAQSPQLRLEHIEHGFQPWSSAPAKRSVTAAVESSPHAKQRIRLLFIGRLVTGKGLELLEQAWPLIQQHVHLTLLGCGRSGRCMLGAAHVDVIMEYDWQQLPDLISHINPHAGLLLSSVSETYSYTLTELMALGLPVIATRRGSFVERIMHGENGLLIEPEPQALQTAILELIQDPELLQRLQQGAKDTTIVSLETMQSGYQQLWQNLHEACNIAALPTPVRLRAPNLQAAQNLQLQRLQSWQSSQLEQQQQQLHEQTGELIRRAGAIHRQHRRLEQLSAQLQQQQQQVQQLRHQSRVQQQQHDQAIIELQQQLAAVLSSRDQILDSRSWKLTRPLRVLSRLLANLRRQQAWNPLRWPRLLSSFSKLVLANGLLASLRQMQINPLLAADASTAEPDHSTLYAQASAADTLHWQHAAAEPDATSAHLLVCIADLPEAAVREQLLPLLLHLDQAMQGQAAVLHVVATDAVAELLASCQGILLHASKAAAVQALLQQRERIDSLLVISTLLQLRNSTLTRMYLARQAGHAIITARREDPATTRATVAPPQQAVAQAMPAFHADLFLLDQPLIKPFLNYCRAQSSLPEFLDASLLALANADSNPVWQSTASYKTLHAQQRPLLQPDHNQPAAALGCILVVDVWVPMADKDSGSLRMLNVLKLLLELGWQVVFVPINLGHAGHYTEQLQQLGVEVWYQPWFGSWKTFLAEQGQRFDLIVLSRLIVASELLQRMRRYCPQAQIIYDTVDLHYLREQRQAELQNSLALRRMAATTRQRELKLMQAADMTLVVSAAEQTLLHAELPEADIRILSNIHTVAGRQQDFLSRSGVLFVGGFQHPPNVDAAIWLAEQIWPLVQQQLPGTKLHLIGSNAPAAVHALADDTIIVHGFVEQLEPWLDRVRCTVAPLRYGAGVKGKINSSMSRGVPVVATSIAAEGMFMQHEQDALLADSAEDFATCICRLHEDTALWDMLSDHALLNVQQHFSTARARIDLQQIINVLRPGLSPPPAAE